MQGSIWKPFPARGYDQYGRRADDYGHLFRSDPAEKFDRLRETQLLGLPLQCSSLAPVPGNNEPCVRNVTKYRRELKLPPANRRKRISDVPV